VIYEAGIQIFAERHDKLQAFEAVDFLKRVPSTWTRPASSRGIRPATPSTPAARARSGTWPA
jgi:hypothetical protein